MPVAAPTYDECFDMIRAAAKIIRQLYLNAVDGSLMSEPDNALTTLIVSLGTFIEGVYAGDAEVSARGLQNAYSSNMTSFGRLVMDPLIFEIGRVIQSRGETPEAVIDDLFEYMATLGTPDTIEERSMGFDTTPSAGSGNIGNGTVIRHTGDMFGYTVENAPEGRIILECENDKNNGSTKHNEVFRLRGEAPNPTALQPQVHQGEAIVVVSGPTSSLLDNSSMDDATFAGAAPLGWSASVPANITVETSTVYIGARSAKLTGATTLFQVLAQSLDAELPYCLFVIWNRNGSAGTLTLNLGSLSSPVTVSAQTGWQVASLSSWYRLFKQDGLNIGITWAGSTHNILIDSIIFVPMFPSGVDSTHFTIVPSSDSVGGFFYKDTFEFTDDHDDLGHMQMVFYILYGKYLPHSSSPTIADVSFA